MRRLTLQLVPADLPLADALQRMVRANQSAVVVEGSQAVVLAGDITQAMNAAIETAIENGHDPVPLTIG